MRVAAIVNPVSGRGRAVRLLRVLAGRLQDGGVTLDVLRTAGPGDAVRFAADLAPDIDVVLAVGGDGTLCDVIHGLKGRRMPVLSVPTGTENIVAREFGLTADANAIARTLLSGSRVELDVGMVNATGRLVGRRFLIMVGVGFDADVIERITRRRRGSIDHLDYFWPVWQAFGSYRFPRIRVEADGECVFDQRGLVWVGALPRYAMGLRILEHARFDDGLLDVCAMPCGSRLGLLSCAANVWRGRHLDQAGVVYRQCKEVRITSDDRAAVQVDGDVAGTLPITCRVESKAAILLTPGGTP